ncbi:MULTISPECIES: AMP-binding protein [Eubacterium]|uniref:Acyl-CoA synthetase (AMP-forming)/AMP-acid ligase II n=1 Tax=Eubacterium barkeri TaxID=1528 RepID=A0A1H3GHF0_EUBBA|nr:AMP-binding protein [Eubacterium barkeri]SDY01719.1 Acyl-CoA synthetase (AMP-forming)/AMP-acid ligase II [Eubacterium barkeri]
MFLELEKKPENKIAAIDCTQQMITYGELTELCLSNTKIMEQRSLVFIVCNNEIGSLVAYLYSIQRNCVPLLINESIDNELLTNLKNIYQPNYIFRSINSLKEFEGVVRWETYGYELIELSRKRNNLNHQLELLMTTSGSTGSPKLVRYKKGNLEANAKNVAKAFSWDEHEKPLCDLSMSYTMGLNIINTHLYVGATLLLTNFNIITEEYWHFLKKYRATNFTGVPFSYDLLLKLHFKQMNIEHLKTLAQGGGKLSDKIFKEFAEFAESSGKRFIATFGTTETSARISYLPNEYATKKIGSIGKAIPEGELFLIDEDKHIISEVDKEGELVYKGPNVTLGYAECLEDLSKGDEFQGVFYTGDIAKKDEDGFYYIVGRKSRFLKLLGYRISLDQCESLIKVQFSVECACTGDDDKMLVFIAGKNDANEIKYFLSQKTGIFQKMFKIIFIDKIPRNETGKIMYKELMRGI